MGALFAHVRELAKSETTVLIEGETGTGKELTAEAIHEGSPRAGGPFVVVDCGAIPETMIEAELFGHVRGAFTGASIARTGLFEAAHGGTVFIDEVGELPLSLQPRFLRVLEEGTVAPVGSDQRVSVDVRVVAATHRTLEREVEEGRFRRDLYYRLSVSKVTMPPLRDRPEDIVFLSRLFLGASGRPDLDLAPNIQRALVRYPWPGNVRELRNVIERSAALSDTDLYFPELGEHGPLDQDLQHSGQTPTASPLSVVDSVSITRPLWEGKSFREAKRAVLDDFEAGYIQHLLEMHHGNVSQAARAAGIHRNLIHRMLGRASEGSEPDPE
jgi:transcriptional regulator with PAS, ATPase and Fis domain